MPAIWSSSERPMRVPTVWVNGIRHAILSQDDPHRLKHRTRPQTSVPKEKMYPINYLRYAKQAPENLSSCFLKLRIVMNNPKKDLMTEPRGQSAPAGSSTRQNGKAENQLCEIVQLMRNYEDDFTIVESAEDNEDSLSNRVIQWLNLCGKDINCGAQIRDKSTYDERQECELKKKILQERAILLKREISQSESKGSLQFNADAKLRRETIASPRWAPNRKPQLHIFIPKLNASSSLESLNYF